MEMDMRDLLRGPFAWLELAYPHARAHRKVPEHTVVLHDVPVPIRIRLVAVERPHDHPGDNGEPLPDL